MLDVWDFEKVQIKMSFPNLLKNLSLSGYIFHRVKLDSTVKIFVAIAQISDYATVCRPSLYEFHFITRNFNK